MNKIDSRFLNFSTTVIGKVNEPPASPNTGDQYIVDNNPTGAFTGFSNAIARYDGRNWLFIQPSEEGHELLNLSTGEVIYYNGLYWINKTVIPGSTRTFGDCLVRHIEYMLLSGENNPSSCKKGEKFLNRRTNKIHTAISENTWDEGINAPLGWYILQWHSGNTPTLHFYDGIEYIEKLMLNNMLFIVNCGDYNQQYNEITNDLMGGVFYCYYYDTYNSGFRRIYPIDTSEIAAEVAANMSKPFTETHEITSAELDAKEFTLTYNVESGEETNVLCFVGAVIQPVTTAFSVSGNTLSWSNKTLDGIVNVGDVFIVQYVKAAE